MCLFRVSSVQPTGDEERNFNGGDKREEGRGETLCVVFGSTRGGEGRDFNR